MIAPTDCAALSGDTLLDGTAGQIGINQPPLRALDSLAQRGVVQSLAFGETGKRLGLERLQTTPRIRVTMQHP